MRRSRFFKHLPTAQSIQENRYLKPFSRYLHHHALWQFNRRSVAGGVAVGLFFGILMPVAQILFSAVGAIIFRVNLPVAAFATFVTNPFTFPPIYYAAYKLGAFLTGKYETEADAAVAQVEEVVAAEVGEKVAAQQTDVVHWADLVVEWVQSVGGPLIVGLLVLAVASAAAGYFLVGGIWRVWAVRRWKSRRRDE